MNTYDWEHYHRAQQWLEANRPEETEEEFPRSWDEAWEATKNAEECHHV